MSKAVEMPMAFIIFLIILIIVFALFLIWNLTGSKTFDDIVSSVACGLISNTSRGNVTSAC